MIWDTVLQSPVVYIFGFQVVCYNVKLAGSKATGSYRRFSGKTLYLLKTALTLRHGPESQVLKQFCYHLKRILI